MRNLSATKIALVITLVILVPLACGTIALVQQSNHRNAGKVLFTTQDESSVFGCSIKDDSGCTSGYKNWSYSESCNVDAVTSVAAGTAVNMVIIYSTAPGQSATESVDITKDGLNAANDITFFDPVGQPHPGADCQFSSLQFESVGHYDVQVKIDGAISSQGDLTVAALRTPCPGAFQGAAPPQTGPCKSE